MSFSGTCPHWSPMNMIVLRCSKHNTNTHTHTHTRSEVSVLFCSHFWVRLAKPSGSNSASRTDTVFSARPTVKCFMDVSMPSVLRVHWQIKVGPIPLVLDFGEISPVMMNIWWDSDEIWNIWNFRRAKCPWTPSRTDVVAVGQNLRFSAGWCSTKWHPPSCTFIPLRGSNGLHLSGWSH